MKGPVPSTAAPVSAAAPTAAPALAGAAGSGGGAAGLTAAPAVGAAGAAGAAGATGTAGAAAVDAAVEAELEQEQTYDTGHSYILLFALTYGMPTPCSLPCTDSRISDWQRDVSLLACCLHSLNRAYQFLIIILCDGRGVSIG